MTHRTHLRTQVAEPERHRGPASPAPQQSRGSEYANRALSQRLGNQGILRLVRHQLTPALQAGGSGALVQRQSAPAADDIPASLVDDLVAAVQAPLLSASLGSDTSHTAVDVRQDLILKRQWPVIRRWIVAGKFGGTKPAAAPRDFPDLGAQEITDALSALSKEQRAVVADAVLDRLVSQVGSQAPQTYRDEFARLSRRVKDALEPDADPLVGYVTMREGLKATFGSIDALNSYFDALVEAQFPPVAAKIVGQQSLVHVDLKNALDRAAALLKAKSATQPGLFEAVVASISGFDTLGGAKHVRGSWSTSIRENRNRPDQIGNHSFGFSIDIHSTLNPNLPNFRWDLVRRLTDVDVYGADMQSVRPGKDFDVALQGARNLRRASDRFREAFSSEANLRSAMANEATKARAPVAPAELFKAVAAAAADIRADAQAQAALKTLLLDAMTKEDERRARAADASGASVGPVAVAAQDDPPVLIDIVSGLRAKIRSRSDLDRLMRSIEAQLVDLLDAAAPADKHEELEVLFSKRVVAELRRLPENIRRYELPGNIRYQLTPRVRTAEATALTTLLIEMHRLFTSSQKHSGGSDSLAGAAAHGFMNLMPELVAALTSSQGGNLLWLGSSPNTKDWMHFELSAPPKITPQGEWP
jgi:hypothetical protein